MAKISIFDEFTPEDNAMLQALYSRSSLSVTEHVEKVRQAGSGKFMSQYYVGYGHQSIADCGSTTLFIEGVSMLADKAIQDWPLYSGQECSSRYLDFSARPIIDPVATDTSGAIIRNWMEFYAASLVPVQEHIRGQYPRRPEEAENVYEKAVKARSFDILRGFLPAGVTTQLSWHTNLRQAHDKLCLLRYHPLAETRTVAEAMIAQLRERYEHSFSHPVIEAQEAYRQEMVGKYAYFDPAEFVSEFHFDSDIDPSALAQYAEVFGKRPEKTGLPFFLYELGLNRFEFLLDFGSFRDIQRHRSGSVRMPLLTTRWGFHNWYLDQLPAAVKERASSLIAAQTKAIEDLPADPADKQYYAAMGFLVPCRVALSLPAAAYVTELRSGRAVHPTLRAIAHKMHGALMTAFPILKLNCDLQPDEWDVRRGLHDIIQK